MIAFNGYNLPRYFFGEGCAQNISAELKVLGAKTIMAVFDEGIKAVGIADKVLNPIKEAGFKVVEFGGVTADPPAEMIEEAAKLAKANDVDTYVAIGGGGVIDTTKCMSAMQHNEGRLLDYVLGKGKMLTEACPRVIAVPTTSGTGSEATALSIVTDTESQRKVCVKDIEKICPYCAYMDPDLLTGLPKGLTASTGMDALSHAVEAYLVKLHNDYSDMYSAAAIKRIVKYLPIAVADGKNIEARGQMMLAAQFAGSSFASSTLQAGHAIAHGVGASLHVPHGTACAWGLNFAIKHCGKTVPVERLQELAGWMDIAGADKMDRQALVDALCAKVKNMNETLGVPTPKTFKDGAIASKESMEAGFNATWTNEQGMLGVADVKAEDKDSLHAYFEEMWAW